MCPSLIRTPSCQWKYDLIAVDVFLIDYVIILQDQIANGYVNTLTNMSQWPGALTATRHTMDDGHGQPSRSVS